jgi:ABC-type polysaccharide/polyol phosphate export permease
VQLPEIWTHRTAARSWHGPLDDEEIVVQESRAHRKATHARTLHVLWVFTRSDFRARYRAQALGVIWSLLNPLVMMAIFSLIFTKVFKTQAAHFPIFLLIGLIVWEWISQSISAATQVFISNADVIKRTVFAREVLPTMSVASFGINFLISSVVLLVFVPIFPGAFKLSPALLLIPPLLGLMFLLIVGVGLATSVLNVIYRDVAYLVNTGLLILYWLTPVIYPLDVIPEPARSVLSWNPFGRILLSLRGVIMEGQVPDAYGWMSMSVTTTVVFAIGWWIFKRNERLVLDYV